MDRTMHFCYFCGMDAVFFLKTTKKWCCSKSPNSCPKVKERKRISCLARYGVDNPNKLRSVREKIEATNLKRHGSKYVVTSEGFQAKSRQTSMKNHGVDHPMKSEAVREILKSTWLDKYGVDHVSKVPAVLEKRIENYRNKHGVDHPFQHAEVKSRIRETMLERYGVENPGMHETFRTVAFQTSEGRYGQAPYVSKAEHNWLKKHGVEQRQRAVVGASGKTYFVDGLKGSTVYEFFGIYWHGHPDFFNCDEINKSTNCSFGDLLNKTRDRVRDIKEAGYDVVAIWEHGEEFEH